VDLQRKVEVIQVGRKRQTTRTRSIFVTCSICRLDSKRTFVANWP